MTAPDDRRAALLAAARCLALDRAATSVTAALTARGIDSVLLKGSGLAERLYDDPNRRDYGDVDLLVAPADFDRARRALDDLGCTDLTRGLRAEELLWYEQPWCLPGEGSLTIDLHRGFHGVGDPDAFWQALRSGAEPHRLAGGVVAVPDAVGCALVVALHAANPGSGTKTTADLEAALTTLPTEVWEAAADLARTTAAERSFAEGLAQAADGAALAATLGLARATSPVTVLTAHRDEPATLSLAQLGAIPGYRAKAAHLMRRLVPSSVAMRRTSALARRGRAGLLTSYLVRIGKLSAHTPAAMRELHQVRRRRGQSSAAARGPLLPSFTRAVRLARRMTLRESLTCAWAVCSLVRARRAEQRWHARRGVTTHLVVAVTAPEPGFRAHAWLEGDEIPAAPGIGAGETELLRRSTPRRWLAHP